MSEDAPEAKSERKPEAAPEAQEEKVDGREVFVARDESGVTAVSESEKGADPRVVKDSEDDEGDEDKNSDDSNT
ncbi:MAG: hypothetical protein QOG53_673 [Frankiales bacterium]|jgi:hypothetical protein|nr:hypothetical protein [Frankiales bacterium]